ncbi:hypothetical protein SCHPADRAFT_891987 [Schizopora paradoxa]|uniref:Uncharacterized protein n=1 Tax=Schizopora paradoxa TaxID=27342 RepID=A0A0H2RGI7_9AGAM|nr:hypothetical protein SCHPADRAFT_891987 [Schizopora paradoxa]
MAANKRKPTYKSMKNGKVAAINTRKVVVLAFFCLLANLQKREKEADETFERLEFVRKMQLRKESSRSSLHSTTGSEEFVDIEMDVDANSSSNAVQTGSSDLSELPSPVSEPILNFLSPEEEREIEHAAVELHKKISADPAHLSEEEEIEEEEEFKPVQVNSEDPLSKAFAGVKKLQYVEGLMLANDYLHTPVVNMEDSFQNTDISRFLAVVAHRGSDKIRNLALCEPSELVYDKYLLHTKSDPFSLFFIPAVVKYASLHDSSALSKQIGFYPLSNTWPRILALLGKLFGRDILHFSNFNHVITASTKPVSISAGKARNARRYVDGSLPQNAHIPVYDGTDGFDLNNLADQDETFCDPVPGSAVLIICTINNYAPYKNQISRNNITKDDLMVSLNLHAVILINENDLGFNEKQKPDIARDAFGVRFPQKSEAPVPQPPVETVDERRASGNSFRSVTKRKNTEAANLPIRF